MSERLFTISTVYERLYANRPTTTRGRINRAILLIRRGWANMRAYDDCFELSDGGAVLSSLMHHIRYREPDLRDAMKVQRVWSADYDVMLDCPVRGGGGGDNQPDDAQLSLFGRAGGEEGGYDDPAL